MDIYFNEPLKDSHEAIHKAGLDWTVSKKQLYLSDGTLIPNAYSNMRDDTGQPLGVVSSRYEVLQNSEAFSFMDSAIRSTPAVYVGAGMFDEGKSTYLIAKLTPDPMVIAHDDTVNQYITLINNHSGDMRPMAIFSPIRLICENMLAALKRHASIRFSHTKGGIDRMKDSESEYHEMIKVFADSALSFKYLASKSVKPQDVNDFVEKLYPIPEEMVRPGGIINTRERVIDLFENGKGSQLSTRGTFWNLYNAHVEYLDHHHGRDSTRGKSAMIGVSSARKTTSLHLAIDMAKKAA